MKSLHAMKMLGIFLVGLSFQDALSTNDVDSLDWDTSISVQLEDHHSAKNHTKYEQDVLQFTKKVTHWVMKVIEDEDDENSTGIHLSYDFRIKNGGGNVEKPCGDLVIHKFVKLFKAFLKNPDTPAKVMSKLHRVFWQPSVECLERHDYQQLEGGAFVGLQVACGDTPLLKMGGMSGGFFHASSSNNSHSKHQMMGGASLGLDLLQGKVKWMVGIMDPSHGIGELKSSSTENPITAVKEMKSQMKACARNQTLVIHSTGAGGMRGSFVNSTTAQEMSDAVGYGFAFELAYPRVLETNGSGSESEDTPAPRTPSPVTTPVPTQAPAATPITPTPTTAPTTPTPTTAPNTPAPATTTTTPIPTTVIPTPTQAPAAPITPTPTTAPTTPTTPSPTTPAPTTAPNTPIPTTTTPIPTTVIPTPTQAPTAPITPTPTTPSPTTAPTTPIPTTTTPTTVTPVPTQAPATTPIAPAISLPFTPTNSVPTIIASEVVAVGSMSKNQNEKIVRDTNLLTGTFSLSSTPSLQQSSYSFLNQFYESSSSSYHPSPSLLSDFLQSQKLASNWSMVLPSSWIYQSLDHENMTSAPLHSSTSSPTPMVIPTLAPSVTPSPTALKNDKTVEPSSAPSSTMNIPMVHIFFGLLIILVVSVGYVLCQRYRRRQGYSLV